MTARADAKARFDLEGLLASTLQDYRDLQAPVQHDISRLPTAVEALRMVNAGHPAIIHDESFSSTGVPDWDSAETYATLISEGQAEEDGFVSIAVTDDGFADSVRLIPSKDPSTPNGIKAFVKPLEEKMPVQTFLRRLRDPDNEPEVLYLQSQDGNIYRSYPREGEEELRGLRMWVKRDVEWMREATGESADAVNLWIGSERSSTSLHHDPYDNIYHVLSGTKTFTLISPIEGLWLDQRFFPSATLYRSESTLNPKLDAESSGRPVPPVPWVESSIYPKPIQPIVVTVQKGETLFLPAGWWHAVDQKEGPGGVAVAVNYWYTSPLHPERNALFQLAQRAARLAGREGVIPVVGDVDSSPSPASLPSTLPAAKHPGTAPRLARDDEAPPGEAPSGEIPADIWGDEDDDSGEEWDPTEWRKQRQEAQAGMAARLPGAA